MSKLTVRQKRQGAVNVYAVTMVVYVHHQSEKEARSYLTTALGDWACAGALIPKVEFAAVEESSKRFFVREVVYPENLEPPAWGMGPAVDDEEIKEIEAKATAIRKAQRDKEGVTK